MSTSTQVRQDQEEVGEDKEIASKNDVAKNEDEGSEQTQVQGQLGEGQGQGEEQETARQRLRRLQENLKKKKEKEKEKTAMAKAKATAKEENWVSIQSLNLQGPAIHPTHKLHHRRGIVWCWGCGKYATEYIKPGLAAPCLPEVTRGANYFLSRLREGLAPRQDLSWPYDLGHGPPEGRVRV